MSNNSDKIRKIISKIEVLPTKSGRDISIPLVEMVNFTPSDDNSSKSFDIVSKLFKEISNIIKSTDLSELSKIDSKLRQQKNSITANLLNQLEYSKLLETFENTHLFILQRKYYLNKRETRKKSGFDIFFPNISKKYNKAKEAVQSITGARNRPSNTTPSIAPMDMPTPQLWPTATDSPFNIWPNKQPKDPVTGRWLPKMPKFDLNKAIAQIGKNTNQLNFLASIDQRLILISHLIAGGMQAGMSGKRTKRRRNFLFGRPDSDVPEGTPTISQKIFPTFTAWSNILKQTVATKKRRDSISEFREHFIIISNNTRKLNFLPAITEHLSEIRKILESPMDQDNFNGMNAMGMAMNGGDTPTFGTTSPKFPHSKNLGETPEGSFPLSAKSPFLIWPKEQPRDPISGQLLPPMPKFNMEDAVARIGMNTEQLNFIPAIHTNIERIQNLLGRNAFIAEENRRESLAAKEDPDIIGHPGGLSTAGIFQGSFLGTFFGDEFSWKALFGIGAGATGTGFLAKFTKLSALKGVGAAVAPLILPITTLAASLLTVNKAIKTFWDGDAQQWLKDMQQGIAVSLNPFLLATDILNLKEIQARTNNLDKITRDTNIDVNRIQAEGMKQGLTEREIARNIKAEKIIHGAKSSVVQLSKDSRVSSTEETSNFLKKHSFFDPDVINKMTMRDRYIWSQSLRNDPNNTGMYVRKIDNTWPAPDEFEITDNAKRYFGSIYDLALQQKTTHWKKTQVTPTTRNHPSKFQQMKNETTQRQQMQKSIEMSRTDKSTNNTIVSNSSNNINNWALNMGNTTISSHQANMADY